MEGGNNQAIFESLNLNPQHFVNEVLNIVDDLQDNAFNFFLEEASKKLEIEGTDRAAELNKGVASIRNLINSTIDIRMQKWEEYCLRYCFHVPEGFSLPKANESSGDDLPDLDALTDPELDSQLNSLRDKLSLVGKESAKLDREIRALERQSLSSNKSAGSIDEALQLYKKLDETQMFQELTTMASEFRAKIKNLKRRRVEESGSDRTYLRSVSVRHDDMLRVPHGPGNGLFGTTLEQLQEILDEIAVS